MLVEMINVRGQDYCQIFPKPTIKICPKCGGCLYETSRGFACGSCGFHHPPAYVKYSESTFKECGWKEGD